MFGLLLPTDCHGFIHSYIASYMVVLKFMLAKIFHAVAM